MNDFKVAILVSDVKDKTQEHDFNGFRYIFRYYYPIDLTWNSDIYIIQLIRFYNHSVRFVIFQYFIVCSLKNIIEDCNYFFWNIIIFCTHKGCIGTMTKSSLAHPNVAPLLSPMTRPKLRGVIWYNLWSLIQHDGSYNSAFIPSTWSL